MHHSPSSELHSTRSLQSSTAKGQITLSLPTMHSFFKLFPAVLLLSSLALGSSYSNPYSPSSTPASDDTDIITCSEQGSGFVSTAQANDLVNEFNRLVCQSNPNAPISLNPLEGITIDDPSGIIIFQNTLNQVATPPNCGEVVGDFQKLLAACFANGGSYGGNLVETAGGGRTLYVIQSP
jgi:hypothetical protein